jgi:hypothetical protein
LLGAGRHEAEAPANRDDPLPVLAFYLWLHGDVILFGSRRHGPVADELDNRRGEQQHAAVSRAGRSC